MDDSLFSPEWANRGLGDLALNPQDLILSDPRGALELGLVQNQTIIRVSENPLFSSLLEGAFSFLGKQGIVPTWDEASTKVETIEACVGDDEVGISNNPLYQAVKLETYPLLGMKVSAEDTSINPYFGNYAEDLILHPMSYHNTYETTRKTGFPEDMSFVDIPKLRLNINISPMRPDHSGMKEGKASMVGKRTDWTPERSPVRMLAELANLHQDVTLGLHRSKKPAYLPVELGGMGKLNAFDNLLNVRNYFLSWKNGERYEFTNHVIHLLDRFLTNRGKGIMDVDPLLSNLVRFSTQFHDWVKCRGVYSPQFWLDRPDWCTEYIVDYFGVSNTIDAALGRAIKENLFITEEKLLVHQQHAELCDALLSQRSWVEFIALRNDTIHQWKKMSIYGQLALGQITEVKPQWQSGDHHFDYALFERVYSWFRTRGKDIKNMVSRRPVYRSEVIDKLYDRSCMRVHVPLEVPFEGEHILVERDVQNARNITRLRSLYEWISKPSSERGDPPREMVDDDHEIVKNASAVDVNVIITDDSRLCRRVSGVVNTPVIRVPVAWYYKSLYYGEGDSPWLGLIQPYFVGKNLHVVEDTGSIEAFEEKHFLNGVGFAAPIRSLLKWHKDCTKYRPILRTRSNNHGLEDYEAPWDYPRGHIWNDMYRGRPRRPVQRPAP